MSLGIKILKGPLCQGRLTSRLFFLLLILKPPNPHRLRETMDLKIPNIYWKLPLGRTWGLVCNHRTISPDELTLIQIYSNEVVIINEYNYSKQMCLFKQAWPETHAFLAKRIYPNNSDPDRFRDRRCFRVSSKRRTPVVSHFAMPVVNKYWVPVVQQVAPFWDLKFGEFKMIYIYTQDYIYILCI